MKTPPERKPAAATPRTTMKTTANATVRRSRPGKAEASRFLQPKTANPQNAERNYERYLELARAEMLRGDQIAAENFLQHAEHYLRSMREHTH